MSTRKRTQAAPSSLAIPGARVTPARKRGGARSRDPSPAAKRRKLSAPEGHMSSSQSSAGHAKVIKAVKKPLFLPSDDDFPDDGLDAEEDDDNVLSNELVDFITNLGNDDLDDDDDEDEDFEPNPEAASTGDEDEDEDAGSQVLAELDDEDGDEDHVDATQDSPATARQVQRRRQADIELTSSTPTRVSASNKHPNRAPRTPDDPQTPETGDAGRNLFTPYVNRVNPKDASKPLLTLQSPITRNIVKRAQQLYRASVVTKDAFPEDESRVEQAAKCILKAANELGAPRRVARFQADPVYQDNSVKMVKRADTQVRGEIVAAARDIIGPAYGLGAGRGSPDQNKRYVEMLNDNGNFVFRELVTEEIGDNTIVVTERAGPYRNTVIATLIQQEIFNGHEQMAVAEITTNLFNPVPLPVIAIAATAIQCALRDWSSGVRVKSASEFSSDEWSSIYAGHMRNLLHMLDNKPIEVDAWTRKLWRDCWMTTSQFLLGHSSESSFITTAEMDDFEDVLDPN